MKTHELKTDPAVFQSVWEGIKKFEIRKNDRDFSVGDLLTLKETMYSGEDMKGGCPLEYTSRTVICEVNYILHGPIYGLAEGWVILAIDPTEFGESMF